MEKEESIGFIKSEQKFYLDEIVQIESEIKEEELEVNKLYRENEQLKSKGLNNADLLNPSSAKARVDIYNISVKISMLEEKIKDNYRKIEEKKKKIEKYEMILANFSGEKLLKENGRIEKEKGIRVLENSELERKRIARDLHDSTIQSLVNFAHKIELCSKIIDSDIIRVKLELATMSNNVKSTIDEIRDIIYDLRPMSVDDLGIVVAVQQYIDQMKGVYEDIEVQLDVEGKDTGCGTILDVTLFRIIQEACQNAFKYAKASIIIISLKFTEESVKLVIEDDGIGFNLENVKGKMFEGTNFGYGLTNMKERVELLQGDFILKTEKEQGTVIEIIIPI